LSGNEKDKQRIKKISTNLNVLRFWVECVVISLCGYISYLILVWSHWCFTSIFSSSGIRADGLWPMVTCSNEYNLILISKVLQTEFLVKHVP